VPVRIEYWDGFGFMLEAIVLEFNSDPILHLHHNKQICICGSQYFRLECDALKLKRVYWDFMLSAISKP